MRLTGKIKITKVLKKTNASLFKILKEGDVLELAIALKAPGRGRGLYATNVSISFENDHRVAAYESLTVLMNRLENFEWEEYEENTQGRVPFE